MTTENQQMLAALGKLHDDISQKIPEINGKIAEFAQASDDLMGVVHNELYKSIYVDQSNGDDAGAGTVDEPVKTLQAAVNSVPITGAVRFMLVGEYNLTEVVSLNGRWVSFFGVGNDAKIVLAANGPGNGTNFAPGLKADNKLPIYYLACQNITVELPADDTTVNSNKTGLMHGVNLTVVRFYDCEIIVPETGNRTILSGGDFYTLNVNQVVTSTDMAGRWLFDAPAATDPATLPNFFTNLTSI